MQVQTTNTVDYITATKDTTKTNKVETTSDVKFDMSKPFDIDSFTFEDYKFIDRKDLGDWIKNSNLPNKNEVSTKVGLLMTTVFYSDDDTLNEVLFDKLDQEYKQGGTGTEFLSTVLLPLGEMASPFDLTTLKEIKNTPTKMERYFENGVYSFDAKDVLSNIKSFPDFYNNLDSEYKKFMGDISGTNQAFNEIITEYTKRKDEQNATLDAYTRNTKQNPVSEKI